MTYTEQNLLDLVGLVASTPYLHRGARNTQWPIGLPLASALPIASRGDRENREYEVDLGLPYFQTPFSKLT